MDIEQNNRELSVLLNNVRNKVVTRGGQYVMTLASLMGGGSASSSTTMTAGKIYIANNISQVVFTLPATAAINEIVGVVGKGAGGWKIAQNAGQTIHFGNFASLTGTSGYVQSRYYKDTIMLMCITENTDWSVIFATGALDVNVS